MTDVTAVLEQFGVRTHVRQLQEEKKHNATAYALLDIAGKFARQLEIAQDAAAIIRRDLDRVTGNDMAMPESLFGRSSAADYEQAVGALRSLQDSLKAMVFAYNMS